MNLKAIIFVILCVTIVNIMISIGYSVTTWQYWIALLSVCGSYICGRLHDRR